MATDPQAVRTEDDLARRIRDRLAKTQAASQATQARPTITAGIEVGNASRGEYDEAVRRAAQRRGAAAVGGNTPGAAPAPAPVARPTTVPTAELSAAERAAFQRANPDLLKGLTRAEIAADAAKTNVATGARVITPPSVTAGLTPEPVAASNPAGRVATLLRNPRVATGGRVLGRVAPVVAGAIEGAKVAEVAADDRSSKLDVAEQAAEGTGKFAATLAGAAGGAELGALGGPLAPVTVPLGAIVGGGIGYYTADKAIDYGRGDDQSPIDEVLARQAKAQGSRLPQAPNVVVAGAAGAAGAVGRNLLNGPAAKLAVDQGITPVSERVGRPDEVLGNFNGRAITRAHSDELAARNLSSTPGAAPRAITDNLLPQQGGGGGGDFNADAAGKRRDARVGDLLNSSTPAGKIYQQLIQDKTPTGKRVAAQFASEYLGAGTSEVSDRFDLAASREGNATALQRGREGDAAAASLEDKRQAGAKKQSQYVFNEDGSITRLVDGIASGVTDAEGKPVKGPKKKGGLEGLQAQESLVKTRLEAIDPNNELTTEERAAARKQILDELAAFQEELDAA